MWPFNNKDYYFITIKITDDKGVREEMYFDMTSYSKKAGLRDSILGIRDLLYSKGWKDFKLISVFKM